MCFDFLGEDHEVRRMTYAELYDEVARTAISLKHLGIRPGDRVAGFMPNMPETVIAMLAAKKIIHGQEVLNKDALTNPEALDHYADLKELRED